MDFSILNQVPISHNGTAQQALKQAIELAVVAEETGYARYFVAEHHNTNNLVSTAPEIVVAHLLAKTEKSILVLVVLCYSITILLKL